MNLFIDTISTPCTAILFDNERNIEAILSWNIKGNESSTLIPSLSDFLSENNLKFPDIEHLILVNGPGSFTGVRTSVLVVNSIAFTTHARLTALSYFDLFSDYPIVKSSSKRDCFVQKCQGGDIEIIENSKLKKYFEDNDINKVYGEANKDLFAPVEIVENIDYMSIIKYVQFDNKSRIEPLYIKKPNIS